MYTYHMSRKPIKPTDRAHGVQLGQLVAAERDRQGLSAPDLAQGSGVSVDAVRSLEGGRVPTPSFLTIAKLASSLCLSLDELHKAASHTDNKKARHDGQ